MRFFIRWCGPCVRIAPKVEEWSTGDFKDNVVFFKVDVDQAEAVSQEYNVEAMPTFVFFKDEKEVHRMVGANVDQLKSDIEKYSKAKSDD
jgi:thioredoxin 1